MVEVLGGSGSCHPEEHGEIQHPFQEEVIEQESADSHVYDLTLGELGKYIFVNKAVSLLFLFYRTI